MRSATFTKDGSKLAFFVQKGDDWAVDIYELGANKLRQIAAHTTKQVASNSPLIWAPDGKSLLVTLRPDGWAASSRAAYLGIAEGAIVVQDAKEPFLSWDAVRNLSEHHIPAIVSVADGAVRELLPDTRITAPKFSPDGSYIVYGTTEPKKTSYDNTSGTEFGVFKLSLAAGSKPDTLVKPAERRIAPRWNDAATAFAFADRGNIFVHGIGPDSARNLTAKYRRPVSKTDTTRASYTLVDGRPDGGALLVSGKDGYYVLDVPTDSMSLVYPLEADSATRPTRAFVTWSKDGRSIYFTRSDKERWARGLERFDVATKQATELAQDANLYASWHVSDDGSRFVYERSDGDHPNDVFTAQSGLANPHALTNLNPQLAGVALSHTELVSYRDADGKKLFGVLYYPTDYVAGKKYPLVAELYENYFDNGYSEQMDLMASRGYFVLHPSVNLEIGYPGESWEKGVLSAINTLIERGLVDDKKLGVFGTSYGGYATNLRRSHRPDRFAVAVNISGKVDIISFLGGQPEDRHAQLQRGREGAGPHWRDALGGADEIHPALGDHVRGPYSYAVADAHRQTGTGTCRTRTSARCTTRCAGSGGKRCGCSMPTPGTARDARAMRPTSEITGRECSPGSAIISKRPRRNTRRRAEVSELTPLSPFRSRLDLPDPCRAVLFESPVIDHAARYRADA